ncbi:glycosyltransferase [Amphritea sp.]|uniref:glycosyltransferase n=1 Tax=Amphritea sp. TaxID=1872502 RepID=UPI0025BF2B79|nr:glycosyltransferase [Amphritea sp.]
MSYLKKANEALRKKDYHVAIDLYDEVIKNSPALKTVVEFNRQYAKSKLKFNGASDSFLKSLPATSKQEVKNKELIYSAKGHPAAPYLMNYQVYTVDLVIPVYNAFEDVKLCLESVEKNTDGFRVTTYIINDASEEETSSYLKEFCKGKNDFILIEHESNQMYTRTVNDGLRASTADYVVTLNSDTIVSKGWLQALVRCILSDKKIGIVGPLSNAASWQNVPVLLDKNDQFAVNDVPNGMSVDEMAEYVNRISRHFYPRVPFVNGFCFMIAREVIDAVGYLDEGTFPTGYGEENDYCLRAADAGFDLAIADDSYVFHAKSKSFGHEKRKEYSKRGSQSLKAKHGKDKVNNLAGKIRDMKVFDDIREGVQKGLTKSKDQKQFKEPLSQRILFLLPVSGGGGGVHSIVQETMGMRRLGVKVKIAVPQKHLHKFLKVYEDIAEREDLFLGFDEKDLVNISRKFDVIIGTIYTSMKQVQKIKKENNKISTAYYIQDYEPLFSEPGTAAWQEAFDSYTLVPGTILFAKTDWICNKVFDLHGVVVNKVAPSIDHDVYKPKPGCFNTDTIKISAMIRPKTPRRGADRTMRLLKKLHDELGGKVEINIFGCEDSDPLFGKLERNYKYKSSGILTRNGVANVLKSSDIFIDLSDYQAFGRTALEAMSCGATSVVTAYGGVYEYIRNKENGAVVDVFNEEATYLTVKELIEDNDLYSLKIKSLETASNFSINKASMTLLLSLSSKEKS